ncbi:MAG: hypothetical protein IJF84_14630 [Thermoguttaceae bacterium]|nr:hypothetical protein [Thermoguttaceae bacterium]
MTENHSKFSASKYLLLGIAFLSLTFLGCPPPQKVTDPGHTISDPPLVVKRIPTHRKFSGTFVTTGRGTDAKWGIGTTMNFQYSVNVKAESRILSREAQPSGYFKVEEIRRIENVSDNLNVSDLDLTVRLDTLPVKAVFTVADCLTGLYVLTTGDIETGVAIKQGEEYVKALLEKIDGTSLRDMIGSDKIPAEMEDYVNKLAQSSVLKAMGGVRDISGKSYKFTWLQKKSGEPCTFEYTYEDGSKVTNENELIVLKRVNTFIDYYLAPDTTSKPGDEWSVSADTVQEAFDPYVDGTYVGTIDVKRQENEGEDWKLEVLPSNIRVQSDKETTGELKIEKGYAKLEPKSVTLKDLFAEGTASLKKVSKHHLLFTATIEGDCKFQGRLVSEEIVDDQSSVQQSE